MPQWTVAFSQRDRKISISPLMQSTVENADCCSECESAFKVHSNSGLRRHRDRNFSIYLQSAPKQPYTSESADHCILSESAFNRKNILKWGAAIAQWIHLCLPSCCPGFNAEHNIYAFQFIFELWREQEVNKQKEAGIGPFMKHGRQAFYFYLLPHVYGFVVHVLKLASFGLK